MLLNKLYAALAAIAIIGAGWLYVNHLRSENKQLKANNTMLEWAASEHERLAKDAAETNRQYAERQEVIERENKTYRDNVASGKYRVRVKAACPATSQASISGEVSETYATLSRDAGIAAADIKGASRAVLDDYYQCRVDLCKLSSNCKVSDIK